MLLALAFAHFNPLPPHGGRLLAKRIPPPPSLFQSTPSTRRETVRQPLRYIPAADFNPLPPHGGRLFPAFIASSASPFQSTPSTRRETCHSILPVHSRENFNPLPPHGGRQKRDCGTRMVFAFQSTPSTRRETAESWEKCELEWTISIHSLHTEGDRLPNAPECICRNFNPLPPHGGRRCVQPSVSLLDSYFNPLPPHGGRHI